jgi:tetratricopeptide (TPR) repeat protein
MASVARRGSNNALAGETRGADREADPDVDPLQSADRITDTPAAVRPRPDLSLATTTIAVQKSRLLVDADPEDKALQRLLAVSLFKFGEVKLQAKEFDAAEQSFNESVKILRALLAGEDDTLWKDDLAVALVGLARVHVRRDAHANARQYFDEAVTLEHELVKVRAGDRLIENLDNLQEHLGELGDLQVRLGDRSLALKAFDERLQVRRRLAALVPRDAQRLTDLSVAYDRVGQLVRDMGDPNRSRSYFDEALRLDRALYKVNPNRRNWAENLVFSLMRIGDLDRQVGRTRDALVPYEEALVIQRRLASDNSTVGAQGTLAQLLGKMGDVRRRLKEYATAITLHREELDIRRRLLARDPGNLAARRNLSSALDYLGNTLRENADLAGARTAFNEQLELDRAIAKDDPDNITSLTDLAWSLNRLGDLDRDASRHNDAARYYEEALAIQRKLIAREPNSLVRMRALASIASKLGAVRARTSDYTNALALHQEELELRRKLFARATADDNDALRDLSLALDRVGNVLRDMSDLQGALKYFEEELTMDRRFVARAPNNLTALNDLQWTLNKLTDFVWKRLNDRVAARRYVEEMVGVDRRLVERQPTSKDRHRRLKDDLIKLANLQLELSDPAAARDTYGEVAAATERWLKVARDAYFNTSSDANRSDLTQAYTDAGWNAILAGRAAEAVPHLEAALSLNPDSLWNTVNLGHANLFLGRYADAIKLYASVRDRNRGEGGKRTYADEIRDDFALFRRLGITPPEMARAAKELRL